jgi:hypothetical protein
VRSLLCALALAIRLAHADPAEAACALRAEALQTLFAAANDAGAAADARARDLAEASAAWAAQGCGALELALVIVED